jgi:hypothetical protein
MNRSVHRTIPILQTIEQAFNSDEFGSAKRHCITCGKYDPGKDTLGWFKKNVRFSDLEKNSADCDVCSMIVTCLKEYRRQQCSHLPFPQNLSLQCHPGISFEVKSCPSSTSEPEVGQNILSAADLEVYVETGMFFDCKVLEL